MNDLKAGSGIGKLTVNLDNRTVEVDGRPLPLSGREFGILELLFRRTVLGQQDRIVSVGRLRVNLDSRRAEVDGQLVPLSEKEYGILELLCLNRDVTLTKAEILDRLYAGVEQPEAKIIDVFICKLRKKLAAASSGESYIETVWGRGYTLLLPAVTGSLPRRADGTR